jgi:hypothetical protein
LIYSISAWIDHIDGRQKRCHDDLRPHDLRISWHPGPPNLSPFHAMAGSPTKQRVTKPAWWLKSIVAISKSISSVHWIIKIAALAVSDSRD